MIRSFADPVTEDMFYERGATTLPERLVSLALRSLQLLNAAGDLRDLASVRPLRLECLNPEGAGDEYSMSVHPDVRVLFVWYAEGADRVRLAVIDG